MNEPAPEHRMPQSADFPYAPAPAPHPAANALSYPSAGPLLVQEYPAAGPLGRVRPTGVCILLFVVTLGVYGLVWSYQTHEEMKRHAQDGLGGALALVLSVFVGIVMPFLTPAEVGRLYERRGLRPPVSAVTGLWGTLGNLILVGSLVWFVRTNGSLNAYWRSLGARD